MKTFTDLKSAVSKQFASMSKYQLFVVDIDKQEIWDTYLNSFLPEHNKIFRERSEYDCSCCRQFIKTMGNVVNYTPDGTLRTIWDIQIGEPYQRVVDALSKLIKSKTVIDVFIHYDTSVGTDKNFEKTDLGIIQWDHFHEVIPKNLVIAKADIPTYLNERRTNKEVLQSSLELINLDSANIVLELIKQNSLYRGKEFQPIVEFFIRVKKEYEATVKGKEALVWRTSLQHGMSTRIKNTVIGTLLLDLSEGKDLELAVKSFETKVAPSNYKRPTALVTQSMIDNAQSKLEELGYKESIYRRPALATDISVNNVLFADHSVKPLMNDVFDVLKTQVPTKLPNLDKIEEVTSEVFIKDILPKIDSVEILFENSQINNLMTLVAPVNSNAPNMFKWNNNYSWTYNGEVADSMKELVKKAGGKIDGALRFSIQWNDCGNNNNDFDAHCHEPGNGHIYFGNDRSSITGGNLDVDIRKPNGKIAVENIVYPHKNRMFDGTYHFSLHNFSSFISNAGFTAEIEFDGVIHSYTYDKPLRANERIEVAVVTLNKGIFSIKHHLSSKELAKEVWGISTGKFHPVSMIMKSPNHWDDNKVGNEHLFFIIDQCMSNTLVRGFYNEFLSNELAPHGKVFELLASKLSVAPVKGQLSGLGFSSTQKKEVVCRVSGAFNRILKIKF